MATEAPPKPQGAKSNGIPRVSARRPHLACHSAHIYDTICVGFSTVGLGLAVALSDLTLDSLGSIVFLERSPHFSSELGSESQCMHIPFAHDLATLRCPTSPYTFLNYLLEKQGLEAFLSNPTSMSPTRNAFEEYLLWAAEQFQDVVMYEWEVVNVEAVNLKCRGALWAVRMHNTRTGDVRCLVSQNVVFATRREARLARVESKSDDFDQTESTDMLPVIRKMRELCSTQWRADDVLSTLAIKSSETADSLLFESERNTNRAAL